MIRELIPMHTFKKKHTKASKTYAQEHKRNKGKPTKGKVLILHKITRPNSLKIVLSGVANCHNLSFGGRATRDSPERLPRKEYAWSRHQRLFEENIRKTETWVYGL